MLKWTGTIAAAILAFPAIAANGGPSGVLQSELGTSATVFYCDTPANGTMRCIMNELMVEESNGTCTFDASSQSVTKFQWSSETSMWIATHFPSANDPCGIIRWEQLIPPTSDMRWRFEVTHKVTNPEGRYPSGASCKNRKSFTLEYAQRDNPLDIQCKNVKLGGFLQ